MRSVLRVLHPSDLSNGDSSAELSQRQEEKHAASIAPLKHSEVLGRRWGAIASSMPPRVFQYRVLQEFF